MQDCNILTIEMKNLKNELDNNALEFNKLQKEETKEILFLRNQNCTLQEELTKKREHSRTQSERIADQSDRISALAEKAPAPPILPT